MISLMSPKGLAAALFPATLIRVCLAFNVFFCVSFSNAVASNAFACLIFASILATHLSNAGPFALRMSLLNLVLVEMVSLMSRKG